MRGCTWPSKRSLSIKCKIALITNQCITITHEMDVLTVDFILMFGIFGQIHWKREYPIYGTFFPYGDPYKSVI